MPDPLRRLVRLQVESLLINEFKDLKKQIKTDSSALKKRFAAALVGVTEAFSNPIFSSTLRSMMLSLRGEEREEFPRILRQIGDLDDIADLLYSYKGDFSPESISKFFTKYFKDAVDSKSKQAQHLISVMEEIPSLVPKVVSYSEKEAKRVEKQAEAPPKAPLGRLAFPVRRKGKPYESDTELEKELYDALTRSFSDNVPLDEEDVSLIKRFMSKEWYSDVFHEPSVATVYRGISLPKDSPVLLKLMGRKGLPSDERKGVIEKDFVLSPSRGASSSWSTDKRRAKDFARESLREIKLILHARVDDNPGKFVSGPGGLYNVQGFDTYVQEKEAVGLGPIKVFKVEWFKEI